MEEILLFSFVGILMMVTIKRYWSKEKVIQTREASFECSVYNVSFGQRIYYTVDRRDYKKIAPDKVKIIWCFGLTFMALLSVFLLSEHIVLTGVIMMLVDGIGISVICFADKKISSWSCYDDGSCDD